MSTILLNQIFSFFLLLRLVQASQYITTHHFIFNFNFLTKFSCRLSSLVCSEKLIRGISMLKFTDKNGPKNLVGSINADDGDGVFSKLY